MIYYKPGEDNSFWYIINQYEIYKYALTLDSSDLNILDYEIFVDIKENCPNPSPELLNVTKTLYNIKPPLEAHEGYDLATLIDMIDRKRHLRHTLDYLIEKNKKKKE